MSETTEPPKKKKKKNDADDPLLQQPVPQTPFIRNLLAQIRAHDSYGIWENRPDPKLLRAYVLTKEERQEIPVIGDPDPKLLWRMDLLYKAVAMTLEQEIGLVASPLMKVSSEGFGRVVFTVGRLVAIDLTVRDVHRFGFADFEALAEYGAKLVVDGAATVERFPKTAKA